MMWLIMAKHPGGRPTKYNEGILEQSKEYLANYKEHDDIIPSIVGLAIVLNLSKSTIYDWASHEDKQEFSDMLDKIQYKQEQILIRGGLGGEFNAAITKLVLTKHGYHDRVDSDVTSGGKEIRNNFIIQPVTTRASDD